MQANKANKHTFMRFLEYIVKSLAVWVALWLTLALVVRLPISLGWISETDSLAFGIITGPLLFSLVLTGYAVFAKRPAALFGVLFIVAVFRFILVAIVFLYPTYLAWNFHGFLGAVAAFCLPIFSHAWAMYVNIRQGAWGYAMIFGVMICSTLIYDWCRFAIRDDHAA
jgi:hypothetical protein